MALSVRSLYSLPDHRESLLNRVRYDPSGSEKRVSCTFCLEDQRAKGEERALIRALGVDSDDVDLDVYVDRIECLLGCNGIQCRLDAGGHSISSGRDSVCGYRRCEGGIVFPWNHQVFGFRFSMWNAGLGLGYRPLVFLIDISIILVVGNIYD
jgi:hypothetical protein